MSFRIELTDQKASLINPQGYGKEAKTSDFLQAFTPDHMLPVSLRWYDPIRKIYVLEYPPTHRIIHKSMYDEPFRIPVPWQIYICSLEPRDVRMYMRTEQLTSLDDTLNHQFMSNVYRSGTPCQGAQGKNYPEDPLATCRAMIDAIWMTTFNGGCYISSSGSNVHGPAFNNEQGALMPKELVKEGFDDSFWAYDSKGWHKWMEEQTIEDVLTWNYKPTGTVKELVEYLANGSQWSKVQNIFNTLETKTVRK